MTIPIPTIDDFDTSTVMTTIREVVDYLIGMVPQINNGDITDLQTTYTNNTLTITLVKGDGTTISKNVTIQASGGESPYPTDVALSLSGTVLNCDITLSNNTHVTGSQDLATFATYTDVQGIQSDLQEQITGLKLSTSNNNMTLNGDSVQIVKNVAGNIDENNLTISVNGINSSPIEIPSSGDGWEELDLNNLPTDFSAGDELKIWFNKLWELYPSPANWNSAISGDYREDSLGSDILYNGILPSIDTLPFTPLITSGSSGDFTTIGIQLQRAYNWNNPGTWGIVFNCVSLNGQGKKSENQYIEAGDLKNYASRLFRKKHN